MSGHITHWFVKQIHEEDPLPFREDGTINWDTITLNQVKMLYGGAMEALQDLVEDNQRVGVKEASTLRGREFLDSVGVPRSELIELPWNAADESYRWPGKILMVLGSLGYHFADKTDNALRWLAHRLFQLGYDAHVYSEFYAERFLREKP